MNTTTNIAAIATALALVACGGLQRPGIDLEPESLTVDFDTTTPISVNCVRGSACEATAFGAADFALEGDGSILIGDAAVSARVLVEAGADVQPGEDGPDVGANARVCIESPILGSVYALVPDLPSPLCVEIER